VALRTGFLTAKGSLVRSILFPPPADFKFDQDSYKFIGILAAIAAVGFMYTIVLKVTSGTVAPSQFLHP
jgi:cation-transporting ATPase 13A3/4/5